MSKEVGGKLSRICTTHPTLIGLLIKGNNDKKLKFLKIIFHVVDDKKVKSRQSRLTTF